MTNDDEKKRMFLLRNIARAEQLIDSGQLRHIKTTDGTRLPVPDCIMDDFGLIDGQTISSATLLEAVREKVVKHSIEEISRFVTNEVIGNAMKRAGAGVDEKNNGRGNENVG